MLRNCQETLSTPNHQKLRNFQYWARPKFLIKKKCVAENEKNKSILICLINTEKLEKLF